MGNENPNRSAENRHDSERTDSNRPLSIVSIYGHPGKLGSTGTSPNFPFLTLRRGHLLIKEKPPKYSFKTAAAPVSPLVSYNTREKSQVMRCDKSSYSYGSQRLRALTATGPTESKM